MGLWIISSIFDCVIYLPVLHYKIQLFELLFCLFLFIGWKPLLAFLRKSSGLKWALGAYALLALFNSAIHHQTNILLENLGTIYTCLIPMLVCAVLFQMKKPGQIIEKGLIWMCIFITAQLLDRLLTFPIRHYFQYGQGVWGLSLSGHRKPANWS